MAPTEAERAAFRMIADYQFGPGAGVALFGEDSNLSVKRSASGRPRQLFAPDGRLATFVRDGRLTLGFAGGIRLAETLPAPQYRVSVGDESEPFVKDGSNAFAKFVHDVDPAIRPDDEVLVISAASGSLLGVGRAELPATGMRDFERGVAVSIREGRDGWDGHE